MLPSWVKSLALQSVVHGIALNPATKWIIAHTGYVAPYFLLILDSDGNLKGAYTYADIPDYNIYWRNLLLGHDSSSSAYTALVQTASIMGSRLFAFSFSSSNPAPSFMWGFNSFY